MVTRLDLLPASVNFCPKRSVLATRSVMDWSWVCRSSPSRTGRQIYVFDVTSDGQRSLPWPCNSVKVDTTFAVSRVQAPFSLFKLQVTTKCLELGKVSRPIIECLGVKTNRGNFLEFVIWCSDHWLKIEVTARWKSQSRSQGHVRVSARWPWERGRRKAPFRGPCHVVKVWPLECDFSRRTSWKRCHLLTVKRGTAAHSAKSSRLRSTSCIMH